MTSTFQDRYLALIAKIERDFAVSAWRCGDVDLWPLARMDLFLDMHWRHTGQETPRATARWRRVAGQLATPVCNLWKSRRDLEHWTIRPVEADAIVLGDGVSLDLVNGSWQDRFGEAVITELEGRGQGAFLLQPGDLDRLPWRRRTFAANQVDVWSRIAGRAAIEPADLPDLDAVLRFLRSHDVEAPSLRRSALERRAAFVRSAAKTFEHILDIVRPKLAFVVTYYSGLAPALLLACRRRGVLSIDLQHCPQDGAHKAYHWSKLPAEGYGVLPAVFWTWTDYDARNISLWAQTLSEPWHQAVHGGNTQLAGFERQTSLGLDRHFQDVAGGRTFTREILVALQPIAGEAATWESVARTIEAAPADWRWWIRRHPASRPSQDRLFGRLLDLRRDNVLIEEASSLPLPVLLRHMTNLVSLMSGAAGEAALFGVPAVFLSEEARGPFGILIDRGDARVTVPDRLEQELQEPCEARPRLEPSAHPALTDTLDRLEELAVRYRGLVRERAPAALMESRRASARAGSRSRP